MAPVSRRRCQRNNREVIMPYKKEYNRKLVSADEAVRAISPGDVVDYGFFNGKPVVCDQALARRASELKDVMVYAAVTVPPLPEVVRHPGSFIYIDWHWSKLTRMINAAFPPAYYSPVQYHMAPYQFRTIPLEEETGIGYRSAYFDDLEKASGVKQVSIFQVSPMDERGWFNFGPQASACSGNIANARCVIVEVNKNQPVCIGGSEESIHISRVDYIVEAPDNQMLFDAPQVPPTEIDRQIAANIMKFVGNGSCVQLGIGGMPMAVGRMIAESDLKNLGGHTEMLSDAYIDMIESGRMNGASKQIDRFKCVYTFAIGSQKLYDYLHYNRALASYNVDYTNDPRVIAANDRVVSICGAVQADLFSQINAESHNGSQISGNGGMWDFVLGAVWSKGGKSFICMSSTFQDGKKNTFSRIVPALPTGSICTIPRQMVDYIVTEQGVERMTACSTWVRAEKMIKLAHPDFRDGLVKEAEKLKIWKRTNKIA
jgi:acyl-CoA hydrolase